MWISRGAASLSCLLVVATLLWSAAAQAGEPVEKWEYGELRNFPGTNATRSSVSWLTAEGLVRGYEWEGIADKLKAPALKKDAERDADEWFVGVAQRLRTLNYLGEQGWEMIWQERIGAGSSLWIFKRRVGK